MKKAYVFQALLSVAVLLTMTAAVAQHTPITDPATECPALCVPTSPDPAVCMMLPVAPNAGSDCLMTADAPCLMAWPTGPFAGMPTWPVNLYCTAIGDPDGTPGNGDEYPSGDITMLEEDPFVTTLPTPGTYDFCAWTDQLVCSLSPFVTLLPEIGDFSYLVQCNNMDINGEIKSCGDIPVQGNGIPERYELAILAAVLNDTGHALHADAVAAMQTNLDALLSIIIEATTAIVMDAGDDGIEGTADDTILDARAMSYGAAPWLIPSLGGILAASAAMDDPLTNAALDELLGLLADLGIEPPAGGIAEICDGVFACSQGGDISDNGFTNREIYEWFIQENPAMTVSEYVTAAMTATTVPPAKVTITGASGNVDTDVTLTANVANVSAGYSAAAYTWYRWEDTGVDDGEGCDIWDWVVITGETGSSITLSAVQLTDDGTKYAVDVDMDDGSKAVTGTIMAKATLTVTDTSGMPVGGALGLTLLAGACALAGAVGIRRRK